MNTIDSPTTADANVPAARLRSRLSTALPDSTLRMPSSAERTRRAAMPPAATRPAERLLTSTAVMNAPPSERSCSST